MWWDDISDELLIEKRVGWRPTTRDAVYTKERELTQHFGSEEDDQLILSFNLASIEGIAIPEVGQHDETDEASQWSKNDEGGYSDGHDHVGVLKTGQRAVALYRHLVQTEQRHPETESTECCYPYGTVLKWHHF